MKFCLLCKENEANKKGSHIVPHFLLRRIENIEGKTDRGYELGFLIGEANTDSYFGRSVPIEELDKVYGELTDNEIGQNKHPLVVDYFFCSECEDRFAKIESEYANTLRKSDNKIYDSGIASELALLFWASVIWRISVNKKSAVELTKKQNEILRRVLNRCLKEDVSKIDINKMRKSKDIQGLSYRLMRWHNLSMKDDTPMVFHPKFKKPYSLNIGEFILCFSFHDNYNDYLKMDFFGIKDEVSIAPTNSKYRNERILPIDVQKLKEFNMALIYQIMSDRMNYYNSK